MKCKQCGKNFNQLFKNQEFCLFCGENKLRRLGVSSSTIRMVRNREFIKSYKKNKSCEVCGYKKYPEILVFHHKDKKEKGKGINILMKTLSNVDRIKSEMEKCILICPNCHHEIHYLEKYPGKYNGI